MFILIAGCKKDPTVNNVVIPPDTDTFPKIVDFIVIKKYHLPDYSFHENSGQSVYVVNDDSVWAFIYDTPFMNIADTSIDFNTNTVLAVFDSFKVKTPTSFDIINITEYQDFISVTIGNKYVGISDAGSQAYEIVKIQKTNKVVTLREQ